MEHYNIGIIGMGMWGRVLAACFQKDERARITWVNSATEASAQAGALEFKVPNWSLDYHDVLADSSVDAVAIATPPYLHADQLVNALAAGKHVLLEKPMAESPESVAKIVRAAEMAPELLVLDASARHTRLAPKFRFIKSILDSGKLGEIYHIHPNHLVRGTFIEYNPKGKWAMDKKLAGGGPFMDWGVYDLAFHLGLLNDTPELISVQRFTRNDLRDMGALTAYSDIEHHGAAWMAFTGGLTYYYERGAGVHGETPNETRMYGTKGSLRFQFPTWDGNDIEYFFVEDGLPMVEILEVDTAGEPNVALALTTHFLDCLDGAAEPLMPVTLAAKHMDILFKILG